MNVLDLFSGPDDPMVPGGWHNVFREHGHRVVTLDLGIDGRFRPTWTRDILDVPDLTDLEMGGMFDFIAASPPCTAFSVASMGKMWQRDPRGFIAGPKVRPDGSLEPRAVAGITIARHTFDLIDKYRRERNPEVLYIIENPIGAMRVMPFTRDRLDRKSTWYCQWTGGGRAKPTDLWTNLLGTLPMCANGRPDHDAQSRTYAKRKALGQTGGTQGLKTAAERSRIPAQFADAVYAAATGDHIIRKENV